MSAVSLGSGLVPDGPSGGAHTSRTIMLEDLRRLLDHLPPAATPEEYKASIMEENVLGKKSNNSRQRSHRYLRELYVLDPASRLFRALRDLWDIDAQAQPLMAIIAAMARDPLLRATAQLIVDTPEGKPMTSFDLAASVTTKWPDSYSPSIAAKIGRNTASSWTQSGHLEGRTEKRRTLANCRPPAAALALFIGYLAGARGEGLFETIWARVLDRPQGEIREQAFAASQRGWLELRQAGNVVEVGFRRFLRPVEGA